MTLQIETEIELGGGYRPHKTYCNVSFSTNEEVGLSGELEFAIEDSDIDIKYCDCYTPNVLVFDVEDLRKIIAKYDQLKELQ